MASLGEQTQGSKIPVSPPSKVRLSLPSLPLPHAMGISFYVKPPEGFQLSKPQAQGWLCQWEDKWVGSEIDDTSILDVDRHFGHQRCNVGEPKYSHAVKNPTYTIW